MTDMADDLDVTKEVPVCVWIASRGRKFRSNASFPNCGVADWFNIRVKNLLLDGGVRL